MTEHARPQLLKGLPHQPLSPGIVEELATSDVILGATPIESEFNDLITEVLIYREEQLYALVFDPDDETWRILDRQGYDEESFPEVEAELMDRLYEWRHERMVPHLVENDLLPTFKL